MLGCLAKRVLADSLKCQELKGFEAGMAALRIDRAAEVSVIDLSQPTQVRYFCNDFRRRCKPMGMANLA